MTSYYKKPKTVFHVTLKTNADSIITSGIDPLKSNKSHKASWFVDRYSIKWAIAHTLEKHPEATPLDIIIFKVELKRTERKHLKKHGGIKGGYYSSVPYKPAGIVLPKQAEKFIEKLMKGDL